MATKTAAQIEMQTIDLRTLTLALVGDSPLIMHKWSEKARKEMRDKHAGIKAAKLREPRNPHQEYLDSMYILPDDSYAFPVVAFKAAAVDACSQIAGVTKVEMRGAFHIIGEFATIEGSPVMREDMVHVGMGASDLRYRAEFPQWKTELHVRYNANVINEITIRNLFMIAGFAVGVGEWRPQKDGSFGMFHIE